MVSALHYARTLSSDVRALYIDVDPAVTTQVRNDWEKWGHGVPLVVLASPFRSLMEPLLFKPNTIVTSVPFHLER